MDKKRLIVVLGMHRSGTSAITKSLELLGVGLGNDLHPAGSDNPKGFWEDQGCIDINDELLEHLGSAYDRLDLAWADIPTDSRVNELKLKAIQIVSHKLKENNGVWGVKDPRTCRLLFFWNNVFSELECEVSFVMAIRNPASVAASLVARQNMSAEKAYFLWLQHVLPPLSFMKSARRVVVDFDELLENPYLQLVRISDKLGLPLPDRQNSLVRDFENNFLDKGLVHTYFTSSELTLDSRASTLVAATYSLLNSIANDKESLESSDVEARIVELNNSLGAISPAFDYINELEDNRMDLWQAVTERDEQIDSLNQAVTERDEQIDSLNQAVTERDEQVISFVAERKHIFDSTSWKVTKPLRFLSNNFVKAPLHYLRRKLSAPARIVWIKLPISTQRKQLFKHKIFSNFSYLFRRSQAYRSWQSMNGLNGSTYEPSMHQVPFTIKRPVSEYVPLFHATPPENVPVRLIAFYLPQFHAIAENNEWWGEGFTEWTNVKPAQPQFEGHYQPHQPDELGYYNLLDSTTQRKQIELAKLHGVGGFCFYTYWFAGKLLLEKPIENYLKDQSLDFPFCLCWANENWSRRWDGLDSEILIDQKHSPEDDLAFIQHISQYMKDDRYIRIDGKPLLLVYRPSLLPSAKKTSKRWREWCLKNGVGEIYLAYTQSFETVDPSKYGFDAAIEFPPNNSSPTNITDTVKPNHSHFSSNIYDWRIFVERSRNYQKPAYQLFRSVCPSWDNTARRKNAGTVFLHSTPEGYQEWLTNAVDETCTRIDNTDERLVFVNAWNEWAEGAHLEPDQQYGYAYLDATRKALLNRFSKDNKKVIVVSHDAHPHGAQFLALGMVRSLKQDIHLEVEVVLLGEGRLISDFAALGPVHDLSDANLDDAKISQLADLLVQRGFTRAIVNTTVSGSVIPMFHKAGLESVCLVHELPGVIESNHLETQAQQISTYAKAVVFPAQIVADGFSQFAAVEPSKQYIRPQGLYRRNKWRLEKQIARAKLRKQLGLSADTKIVLTVGYADHRKGVDLFVECALKILKSRNDVDFVWVGHWEQSMQKEIEAKLLKNPYRNRIHFVGYNPETALFHAAADVYALTSREDPFPNVVLESFDAGVPVLAFADTGGAANLVEKVGGLVVPEEDMAKFSDAICQLLDNAELSSSLGEAAQSYVDEHFAFRPYLFELCEILGIKLPKVSVVVPNYNYARYIEQRLTSIHHQSMPIYELIILDDTSTDTSVQKISDWLATTQTEARVVINQTNSGSVFSQWEKGVSLATGDYIWIAEADDLSEPDFLQEVISAFDDPEVVMSYCQSKQIDSADSVFCDNYLEYMSDISPDKWLKYYKNKGINEIKTALSIKNTIPNVSAVVFDRNVLLNVLMENIAEIKKYRVAGDWLTYLLVLRAGEISFSPKSLNLHRRHKESITLGSFNSSQLKEILSVQKRVRDDFHPDDEIVKKAQVYSQNLFDEFGLATKEMPDISLSPELNVYLENAQ